MKKSTATTVVFKHKEQYNIATLLLIYMLVCKSIFAIFK